MSRYDTQEDLDRELASISALSNTDLVHHIRSSYAYYRQFDREMEQEKAARQLEYHEMAIHELMKRLNGVKPPTPTQTQRGTIK